MNQMIKNEIYKITKQYNTNDPFELSRCDGIELIFEPLGVIRGYYNKIRRIKFIHINNEMNEHMRKWVCAHELGHARLHSDANTPMLRTFTCYSIGKFEREANEFAADLLIDDNIFYDYNNYTIEEISKIESIPIVFLNIKKNLLYHAKL